MRIDNHGKIFNDSVVISTASGPGALLLDGGTEPTHQSLVENSVGPHLATKGIVPGIGVSMTSTASTFSSRSSVDNGFALVVNFAINPPMIAQLRQFPELPGFKYTLIPRD